MTTGARTDILAGIRRALGPRGDDRAAGYAGLERAYVQSGTRGDPARLALFADRLQHYQVGVHRCPKGQLTSTVAETLASRGRRRLFVPADLPREWLPPAFEFVPDVAAAYEDLDRADGVVTGCTVAIAITGTIALRHGSGEGRRAATLIPDYHLCVVHADQVVETVPEALRRLQALGPALVTTISGPSATSDIEMTRVRGVHGPRTLDVVIVE